MKRVNFKLYHLDNVPLKHDKLSDVYNIIASSTTIATYINKKGDVVLIAGMVIQDGVGHIYLFPNERIKEHTVSAVRHMRCYIDEYISAAKIGNIDMYRMQTSVVDDELHNRWMQTLGFTKEGVLRQFKDGQDYAIYGRVL